MRYLQQAVLGVLVSLLFLPALVELSAISPVLVGLQSSAHFVMFSGTAITSNSGESNLDDFGASPITDLSAPQVKGLIYSVDSSGAADSVIDLDRLSKAKMNLLMDYEDAEGINTPVVMPSGDLVGRGVEVRYKDTGSFAKTGLTGTKILEALGDSEAVWIFPSSSSTFYKDEDGRIVRANGARSNRVFRQVGSSIALKSGAEFKGTIMAFSSINIETGIDMESRARTRNATVAYNDLLARLPPSNQAMIADVYRATNKTKNDEHNAMPFYLLSQHSNPSQMQTNWTTIVISAPVTSPWIFVEDAAESSVILRFNRAYITYYHE